MSKPLHNFIFEKWVTFLDKPTPKTNPFPKRIFVYSKFLQMSGIFPDATPRILNSNPFSRKHER